MEQVGAGNSINDVSDRDKESILSDPFNKLANVPQDMECRMILNVYHSTQKVSNGMSGSVLNYNHLSDNLRWQGMSRKKYTQLVLNCHNYYMSGINSKRG